MARSLGVAGQTREAVRALAEAGFTPSETAYALGVSKATVSYHRSRLGMAPDERFARRYDWDAVQRYHDSGHTARECMAHFGFSSETWHAARRRGVLRSRPAAAPITDYLVKGRRVVRTHLKARLLAEGLKAGDCEECGIT